MRKRLVLAGLMVLAIAASGSVLAQTPNPVDPVNWRELVPFLIDISGYQGDKPDGSTTSAMGFKISQVNRDYTKGEQSIEIEITDGSYIPMVYASFKALESFEVDSSEQLTRKVTIQGYPAIENIEYDDNRASLMILVADRFLVNIKGEKFKDSAELKAVAEKMDLKGLASLTK